jgi:hypothetical protein
VREGVFGNRTGFPTQRETLRPRARQRHGQHEVERPVGRIIIESEVDIPVHDATPVAGRQIHQPHLAARDDDALQ